MEISIEQLDLLHGEAEEEKPGATLGHKGRSFQKEWEVGEVKCCKRELK